MAFKKQSLSELHVSMAAQLIEIQEITKLCGFAAEARRILVDIDTVQGMDNDLMETMDQYVTARYEWVTHEDNTASVLKIVGKKIQAVIDQMEASAS